jgi:hypothetical protein
MGERTRLERSGRPSAGTDAGAAGVNRYLKNLFRPWKLFTFACGTGFFVWGAGHFDAPTWDVGVSVLMSLLCFFLAPWAVDLGLEAIRQRNRHWPWKLLASAATIYFIASGSYEIYNTIRMGEHPATYWYNLGFSLPVTLIAGFIWRFDGSLADLLAAVVNAIQGRKQVER